MVQKAKQSLADELRPILLRLARHLRRESHGFGVTGAQFSLLVEINERPGITSRELAERERVSAPAMSAHVARLEGAGLVRRDTSPDRRRAPLLLTPEGSRVLRGVKARRTAWLTARLDRLAADDLRAIEAALGPLESLMELDDA